MELLTWSARPDKPVKLEPFVVRGTGVAGAGRKIEQTINFMGAHLNEPMQVNRLASMVNISPSHFFALFRQCTGFTPIDFFIRLRMSKACELLETTSLSVKEVAAMLGYDDQFYFSRLFKSVHGTPPRAYRAQKEESNDQNLKLKPAGQFSATCLSSHMPHRISVRENQTSKQVLLGGFQTAAQRAKTLQERFCESSSLPDQSYSVSVPQ